MSKNVKRVPPHSQEAEQYVLGCLLLDSSAFEPVQNKIDSSMFYIPAHRDIYNALQAVFLSGIPVDIVSVAEQMKKDDTFTDAGGMEYLNKLASQVVSASSAEYYASIIFDKYILRSLISLSGQVFEDAYSDSKEAKELLEYSQQELFSLSEQADTKGVKKISDLVVRRLDYFRQVSKTKEIPNCIETGFADLDKLIMGFRPGEFILIAARPSIGKSALAMNMAQNMAIRKGKNVLFLSLEMSNEQLTDRMISAEARVANSKLQRGEADMNEWAKVAATAGIIHEAKIFLDDTSSITVADIRSKCRRFKAAENLDIIFIDYLQLIGSAVKKENRQQEVTEISRQLKILAKDLKIPVVALSQLSRASEQRADKVPVLSDLRDSGAIEQDADMVMFIHRPPEFDKGSGTGIVYLNVEKNRSGSTGNVKLVFQGPIVRFDSHTTRDD